MKYHFLCIKNAIGKNVEEVWEQYGVKWHLKNSHVMKHLKELKVKENFKTSVYNNLTDLIKSVEISETQGKFSETYTGFINNVPVLIKILPYNKSNRSKIYYTSNYNNESDPQYIQKIDFFILIDFLFLF